jgi:hypothetical protein
MNIFFLQMKIMKFYSNVAKKVDLRRLEFEFCPIQVIFGGSVIVINK